MDIIKSVFFAALPIAAVSFLLLFYAVKRNYLSSKDNLDTLKQFRKNQGTSEQPTRINPIHNKWLYFGGGFYGTVAFITYIHVEFIEIWEFLLNYQSFSHLIEQITLSAVISLIIESFLNLIPAFTWFLYWPKQISMESGWVWLATSYIGYYTGSFLARYYSKTSAEE